MTVKSKKWIFRIAAFGLGIGVILALLNNVGFKRYADIILNTSPYWLVCAVIFYSISWLFRTLRLELFVVHVGEKINLLELFKLHVAGYALNAFFPARIGDFATIGFLKMKGIHITQAAAIVVQTRLLDLLAVVLLFIPAFVMFCNSGALSYIATSLVLCVAVIAIPLGIVVFDRSRKIAGLFAAIAEKSRTGALKTIAGKLAEVYVDFHEVVMDRKLFVSSVFLSLLIWLVDGITCYIICVAIGVKVPVVAAIGAVSCGNIGKSVPSTPGGIGVYEGILVAVLALFGVSFDVAVVIAILDHTIKKTVNLAFGLPATAGMGMNMVKLYQKQGTGEDRAGE